ncbi:MAG: hypothetical protein AAGA96_04050 [Verrucomicrobiota bacterium]
MKAELAKYLGLIGAAVAVAVVLTMWKKGDREAAIKELEEKFSADVVISEDEFHIGCSSERLVDLVAFASIVDRIGEPTIIDLTGAPNLRSLAGFELIGSVKSLVAIDCPRLESVDGVAGHLSLEELVLTDSFGVTDVSAARDLPRLKTLDFSGCVKLEEVELEGLPSLENLYLSRCRNLREIDVGPVPQLRQLYLDGVSRLSEIKGLSQLGNLTDLDVSNANQLAHLEGIGSLENLIVLDLRNVDMKSFEEIGQLPAIRILRMGGQSHLESLEPFSGLSTLKEIHLEACPNFSSLAGLPASVSQYAGFTFCPKLFSIQGIEVASGLEQLDLTGCRGLIDVSSLESLDNLVQLSLVKCRKVTDISPVIDLPNLVVVMLGGSGVDPGSIEAFDPANEQLFFDFTIGQ